MIKPLLSQIQSILISNHKYYKQKLPYFKKRPDKFTVEQVKLVEEKCGGKLSNDEVDFINWVNFNPTDGLPFINFVEDGFDFKAWGQGLYFSINYLSNYEHYNLELFSGYFKLKSTSEELLFEVYLDVTGEKVGKKGSVYVVYGKIKENYHNQFENQLETKTIIIADNIELFTEKHLKYLKTLPVKIFFSKKIDNLLSDSKKLFKFIQNYNFDDGEEPIVQIIKDSRCDKASALLIYWFMQPYIYSEDIFKEIKPIPYLIEENFLKNFYKVSDNKFDPAQNDIADFIQEYNQAKNKSRLIPEYMLNLTV